MKTANPHFAAIGVVLCFALCAGAQKETRGSLLLIAHRGVVTESLTENSLPSLEETIRRGYTHVEVDIRCTKDGVAVCLHDSSLKRTTGVDARIHEVSFNELRALVDAETVPSLDEFCARAAGRIDLIPDIKDCPPAHRPTFGAAIRGALTKHGLMKGALFIGRKEYVQPGPGEGRVSTGASPEELGERVNADPHFPQNHFVFAHARDFTAENVHAYQALGLPVIVSINLFHYPPAVARAQGLADVQRFLEFGVDGLQIDADYDKDLVARH